MKKLQITLADVHPHFLLRGEEMIPSRSGLKNTEHAQLERAEELLEKFRP